MKEPQQALLSAFDGHDANGVRAALQAGADPCAPVHGKPPIVWLLEQYTRSDRLADCLRLLLERGASLPHPVMAPVLLDDAAAVRFAIETEPELLRYKITLDCTFTPLHGASLLHLAAEYGAAGAARALIESGADVNATADLDQDGLNGHTPLFHTVNSNRNRSEPIMRLLLAAGARTDVRLAGLVWGRGFPWETVLLDVTPISYAQAGLLPQMHRDEEQIYANIRALLLAAGRPAPALQNVPNRYLRSDGHG